MNPLRLRGGHGGALPSAEAFSRLYSPPPLVGVPWFFAGTDPLGVGPRPKGPHGPPSGRIHSREGSQGVNILPGCSLCISPPQMAPIYIWFSVGLSSTDFYRFFGLSWEPSPQTVVLTSSHVNKTLVLRIYFTLLYFT